MTKITLRKDGRYETRITYAPGKRKTLYGNTKAEVETKALEFKLQIRQGIDPIAAQDSFAEWAQRWLRLKSYEVSESRYKVEQSYLKHLEPLFPIAIGDIQTISIQEIIFELAKMNPNTKKPTARSTLISIRAVARQIFELAIESQVLVRNPADYVKLPQTKPKKKRRALTKEEQAWVQETEHRAQLPAMIMLYAGLRRGEVIPLTWGDIDFTDNTITVNKSVERIGNQFNVKHTAKTSAGNRIVAMPELLQGFLMDQPRDGVLITTDVTGAMHTQTSWRRMWESYQFELNWQHGRFTPLNPRPENKYSPNGVPRIIDTITPHMLRHTYATILYFAGVDALTAKDLLGHADIQTTLNIYTHLDDEHKSENIHRLDEYLNDSGTKKDNKQA